MQQQPSWCQCRAASTWTEHQSPPDHLLASPRCTHIAMIGFFHQHCQTILYRVAHYISRSQDSITNACCPVFAQDADAWRHTLAQQTNELPTQAVHPNARGPRDSDSPSHTRHLLCAGEAVSSRQSLAVSHSTTHRPGILTSLTDGMQHMPSIGCCPGP